ncbi:prepilin-type N-terminal cleavage/methylation domain-containing protein [Congregibacter litoralis]|uniref:Prepilin-type N-terminal cleavage/methylation domain protein n=1 Tax=Congregibacter litoralis KT71 TaxID=314285 RepID=A4A5K1_9GAMM|nr:prepilin-type N-terminal cleavage/methylation domain-containing protein [Congregibacter litoralis]EAQ99072.1 prepilin-type N-terminal cleavage/methylation domain protein [Congregibacter litoralis KT71]
MGVQQGFSLIEMLVVLFVIVLMTSLVTLNVNSGASDRVVQERLETLTAVAAYAMDEAQFSGTDFGVLFANATNEQGEPSVAVHWRQRLQAGWRQPQRSPELFTSLEFPADTRLQISLDDVEVLPVSADAADPRRGTSPQWLLSASGETQAGELLIRNADDDKQLFRLVWDPLGRFTQYRGENETSINDYAFAP